MQNSIYNFLISRTRVSKEVFMIMVDTVLGSVSVLISLILRFDNIWPEQYIENVLPFVLCMPVLIILISRMIPIYRVVLRTTNLQSIISICYFSFLLTLSFVFLNFILQLNVPRSIPILFFSIFTLLAITFRIAVIFILDKFLLSKQKNTKNIAIFGAGSSGQQLAHSYKNKIERVTVFIDDNINLKNTLVFGIPVYTRHSFLKNYKKLKIEEIWIAIPTLSKSKKNEIINFCLSENLKTKSMPSYSELIANKNLSGQLLDISPNSFLGRQEISIESSLYDFCYKEKNILITGGGGSIGSEIVKQLCEINPKSIVILEANELALYNIERFFSETNSENKKIGKIFKLGSVCDKNLVKHILSEYLIDVVIHCAAHKHVPILESNILEAFKNNVIGTNNIVESIINSNVKRFLFISTDKAIRPTNVMGATKRLAEQIVKTKSRLNEDVSFGIVRFGNVLGSSGSVIPLFQKQIRNGGPITITDNKMTRYFMAIDEAVKLVLLAGSYAKNSEVFHLDMGEPIKIIDLAKNMVHLAGLTVRTEKNINGDIEIVSINKRPGEKLYEELLIDKAHENTEHPKVKLSIEERLDMKKIENILNKIYKGIDSNDENFLLDILIEHVEKYKPSKFDKS